MAITDQKCEIAAFDRGIGILFLAADDQWWWSLNFTSIHFLLHLMLYRNKMEKYCE